MLTHSLYVLCVCVVPGLGAITAEAPTSLPATQAQDE